MTGLGLSTDSIWIRIATLLSHGGKDGNTAWSSARADVGCLDSDIDITGAIGGVENDDAVVAIGTHVVLLTSRLIEERVISRSASSTRLIANG